MTLIAKAHEQKSVVASYLSEKSDVSCHTVSANFEAYIVANAIYVDTSSENHLVGKDLVSLSDDWTKLEFTFTVPENSTARYKDTLRIYSDPVNEEDVSSVSIMLKLRKADTKCRIIKKTAQNPCTYTIQKCLQTVMRRLF